MRKAAREAAVAATEVRRAALVALLLGAWATVAHGAVLPEDRADAMYHGYDGGGLTVEGPSVLVRKAYKDKVSVWANYYVDMISSASIDVVATASEYEEERKEKSVGVDYLHGKTFMGLSYTNSEESDYSANAVRFGISQDFFGDLTTLGISYARGWDEVRRNGDETFEEDTDRQSFRIDLSQIVTKNMIVSLNYVFLISEMPLELQPKLLRVLESRELTRVGGEKIVPVRARVVSATHRDLVRAMDEGWFRRDLYHRLAVATVEIPPLRERPADLRRLTRFFLRRFAQEQGVPARGLSPEAWQLIRDYAWPGNVRELENVLRRAVLLQSGTVLQADQFAGLATRVPGEDRAWAKALQRWLHEHSSASGPREELAQAIRAEVDRILADWASPEEETPGKGEEKAE